MTKMAGCSSDQMIVIKRTDISPEDDQGYSPPNKLEDFGDLLAHLPPELFGLLRSRRSDGNSVLSILNQIDPDQIPKYNPYAVRIRMDPIPKNFKGEIVIEHQTAPLKPDCTIMELAMYRPPPGWEDVFTSANAIERLKGVSDKIAQEQMLHGYQMIVPERHNVFRAFELTPLNKVRVVIVGQDPYPQIWDDSLPVAQGLAFSVKENFPLNTPTAMSVKRIITVASNTLFGFRSNEKCHGCLEYWARQGVLLINKSLTTLKDNPNSHRNIWNAFMEYICREIARINPNVIFVLWGGEAQRIGSLLDKNIQTITGPHPVAHAAKGETPPFLKQDPFRLINYYLYKKDRSRPPIDWNLSPGPIGAYGINEQGIPVTKDGRVDPNFGNIEQSIPPVSTNILKSVITAPNNSTGLGYLHPQPVEKTGVGSFQPQPVEKTSPTNGVSTEIVLSNLMSSTSISSNQPVFYAHQGHPVEHKPTPSNINPLPSNGIALQLNIPNGYSNSSKANDVSPPSSVSRPGISLNISIPNNSLGQGGLSIHSIYNSSGNPFITRK